MRMKGKTAIVTGGASGFGEGIVRKFLTEGARVLIADINLSAAQIIADELGKETVAIQVNVADGASVENLQAVAKKTFGKIDIIINNAGVTHLPTPLDEISEEDFDRVFNVNCKSVYLMAKSFVPDMKVRKSGVILNVASTAGVSPRPNLNWYNSSKGWMNTATKTMAVELAPFGIRVNAVNPVAGETPLLASFMGEDTPEIRQKFISTIPLGRFSTPQDIANAACYLCSDEASMVTGVCMQVDGGRCI
ncbi:MAG: SDR family oxidoreductase [Paracoccaceae bacterium]|nr:SDR family oxidoreductase [Paracoccaceae bacterium]